MAGRNHRAGVRYPICAVVLMGFITSTPVWAHDPIFGLGPHVVYQGGVEVSSQLEIAKQGRAKKTGLDLELTYGLTGDWAAGVDLPYAWKQNGEASANGPGDLAVFTKYRFWRRDSLGLQRSAAILLKILTPSGDASTMPALGTGAVDSILGLTYGYEGRKQYRWAAVRYRHNARNDTGFKRGDRVFFDLVGGIRPHPSNYLKPDTVWLLELNGEYGKRGDLNGLSLANTGGTEWFLSPGLFWTKRNFAVKAGVQIPIASHLNGNQSKTDYRAKLVFEWHL